MGSLLSDVINCLCTGKSLSDLSCFNKKMNSKINANVNVNANDKTPEDSNLLNKEFIEFALRHSHFVSPPNQP